MGALTAIYCHVRWMNSRTMRWPHCKLWAQVELHGRLDELSGALLAPRVSCSGCETTTYCFPAPAPHLIPSPAPA
jgi:hypothetical protein